MSTLFIERAIYLAPHNPLLTLHCIAFVCSLLHISVQTHLLAQQTGSLGTSVFDPDVYLVGASGGVYALLAAYFANVVLNFNQIELGILKLVGILIVGKSQPSIFQLFFSFMLHI